MKNNIFTILLTGSFLALSPFIINRMLTTSEFYDMYLLEHESDGSSWMFHPEELMPQKEDSFLSADREGMDRWLFLEEYVTEDNEYSSELFFEFGIYPDKIPTRLVQMDDIMSQPHAPRFDEAHPPAFETVARDYWDDALFIGDSRMVGLCLFGGLGNADVFADEGMSTLRLLKSKNDVQGNHQYLTDMLAAKTYRKVYLMLGINEAGTKLSTIESQYRVIIKTIMDYQPEAVIYLMGNMHVTPEHSATTKTHNNKNINAINECMASLAKEFGFVYLDVNPVFDNENGGLPKEITWDQIHIMAKYYDPWIDFLLSHAVMTSDADLAARIVYEEPVVEENTEETAEETAEENFEEDSEEEFTEESEETFEEEPEETFEEEPEEVHEE